MSYENVDSQKFTKINLNETIIQKFAELGSFPADMYNKSGQIIIKRKVNPNSDDFAKLLKFNSQGIYFLASDLERFNISRLSHRIPPKRNDTKIIDPQKVREFAKRASILIDELRRESFSSEQAIGIQNSINEILTDFTSNPDFETGIINVLEILGGAGVSLESELMTKRTIVAMGMKVRNRKLNPETDLKSNNIHHLNLLMASYLSDVGNTKLKLSSETKLSLNEYLIYQQHPILSYIMTLNAPEIETEVRTLILNHHKPNNEATLNNNFPKARQVFTHLMKVRDLYLKHVNRESIISDIEKQLQIQDNISNSLNREEDIAILSLSSEFASLTSNQSWRDAYKASTALKMIVNDSFFSYSNKGIRLLLDYVGASLTNNENVINVGDYLMTATSDSEKKIQFDICVVLDVEGFQTRPTVQRLCTISPIFKKTHKFKITNIDYGTMRIDKRRAIFDLATHITGSMRVIYIIDPEINEPLYEAIDKLYRST
jgi:hypothetical protein